MSSPSVCPLCGGSGKLPGDPSSTAVFEKACHACDGRGIVWPPEQGQPVYTPYPCPGPYYPPWMPYYQVWCQTEPMTISTCAAVKGG